MDIAILEIIMEKAKSYKISNDYKNAIDCYDEILQIEPKYINALNSKVIVYKNLKEY